MAKKYKTLWVHHLVLLKQDVSKTAVVATSKLIPNVKGAGLSRRYTQLFGSLSSSIIIIPFSHNNKVIHIDFLERK